MSKKCPSENNLTSCTYQEIILNNFKQREQRNRAYTLSAFARDLGISKSSLSLILSGKQGLSLQKAHQISKKMDLGAHETKVFLSLVAQKHARSEHSRSEATRWLDKENTLHIKNLSQFPFTVSWMHLAMRELIALKDFTSNPVWMAAKLNISPDLADQIWKDCVAASWIEQKPNGSWQASDFISLGTGKSNDMLKKIHSEVLKEANASLMNDPMEKRYVSSVFFSMSPAQIEEAKELIKDFRRQLASLIHNQNSAEKTQVICFASQLFSITK